MPLPAPAHLHHQNWGGNSFVGGGCSSRRRRHQEKTRRVSASYSHASSCERRLFTPAAVNRRLCDLDAALRVVFEARRPHARAPIHSRGCGETPFTARKARRPDARAPIHSRRCGETPFTARKARRPDARAPCVARINLPEGEGSANERVAVGGLDKVIRGLLRHPEPPPSRPEP